MQKIVIVGAGVAGLTAAYILQKAGYQVTIIERDRQVGGLAKSFIYHGFIFDIGPHRFHTEYAQVDAFIREILSDNLISISRRSGVWMFGRYHDWPLRPKSMFRFPLKVMFKIAWDLIRKAPPDGPDFESHIRNKYGKTIFEVFFKPYTEKFLHLAPRKLSSDWARAGIDRAVIDKRVQIKGLMDLLKTTLLPKPIETSFIYPKFGGIQAFVLELQNKFEKLGGEVILETSAEGLILEKKTVKAVDIGRDSIGCDLVFWTAPITQAAKALGIQAERLRYLDILLYNVMVDEPALNDYQWCYFGGYNTHFSRVSLPCNFSPQCAPEGQHGCCVEVSCLRDDFRWQAPTALITEVMEQMEACRLITSKAMVLDVKIEKIYETYPIYELDYMDRINRLVEAMSAFPNFHLLGRTGTFWYNNMDHSIKNGLEKAKALIAGDGKIDETAFREEFF